MRSHLFLFIVVISIVGACAHNDIDEHEQQHLLHQQTLHDMSKHDIHCSHEPVEVMKRPRNVDANIRLRASSNQLPLRVLYETSQVVYPSDALRQHWEGVFASAVSFFSATFTVNRIADKMLLVNPCTSYWTSGPDSGKCATIQPNMTCGYTTVPNNNVISQVCNGRGSCSTSAGSGGYQADVVIYVTSLANAGRCSQTFVLAFAAVCQMDDVTDRPVAGFMNICNFGDGSDPTRTRALVLHETTHALVFSPNLYLFYRNPVDGSPRVPRDKFGNPQGNATYMYQYYSPTLQRNVLEMRTENVVNLGRQHFDCPTLSGVELDFDSQAHWQQRTLQSEYMCPTLGYSMPVPVSGITLALYLDSGWYGVNFTQQDFLAFGFAQGCDFTSSKCLNPPKTAPTPAFSSYCAPASVTQLSADCTYDRLGYGWCSVMKYGSDLPASMQYFSDPTVGGDSEQRDYCPIVSAYMYKCSDTTLKSAFGESFGPDSRCFQSTVQNTSTAAVPVKPRCYNYRCTATKTVDVLVGSEWVNCAQEGAQAKPKFWNGYITCPNPLEFCGSYAFLDPQKQAGLDNDIGNGQAMGNHQFGVGPTVGVSLVAGVIGLAVVGFVLAIVQPAWFVRCIRSNATLSATTGGGQRGRDVEMTVPVPPPPVAAPASLSSGRGPQPTAPELPASDKPSASRAPAKPLPQAPAAAAAAAADIEIGIEPPSATSGDFEWEEFQDDDGKPYYHNLRNGETVWELSEEQKLKVKR